VRQKIFVVILAIFIIVVISIVGLLIYNYTFQSGENQRWIRKYSYQSFPRLNYIYDYFLLPNKTIVVRKIFSGQTFLEGRNVIDNLTTGYLWANPLYSEGGEIYNQQLYTKENMPFKINVKDLSGRNALYFSSAKLPINVQADLHIYDSNLLHSSKIEGVIVELNNSKILEIAHYMRKGTTLDDYQADSIIFNKFLELYKITEN
jgi:hypothetical protein